MTYLYFKKIYKFYSDKRGNFFFKMENTCYVPTEGNREYWGTLEAFLQQMEESKETKEYKDRIIVENNREKYELAKFDRKDQHKELKEEERTNANARKLARKENDYTMRVEEQRLKQKHLGFERQLRVEKKNAVTKAEFGRKMLRVKQAEAELNLALANVRAEKKFLAQLLVLTLEENGYNDVLEKVEKK